jgi:Glutaminase
MPNPNAIVSRVLRIEQDSIELGNGRRVRLNPERPDVRGLGAILEGLSQLQRPVYLEIDPATSFITRLLIPHVTHVADVRPSEDGLEIELDNSHGRHVLRRGAPDFTELERELRDAMRGGRVVIVTEDDAHNIIDVRGFTPGPDGDLPPLPPFPKPELPKWPWPIRWLIEFWRWRWWPWWWFGLGCISGARAQQVFDAMAATNCNPLTVPPPCIPFMYPDNGCWGRAHEMCRLMITMGVSPKKVWIDHVGPPLKANTRNHPQCFVEWYWHVAPTVCVRRWRFWLLWSQEMVVDPSLFTTPVSKATWKSVQNNPNATLTDTDWTFFRQWGETDPTFAKTNNVLATYRLTLQQRSVSAGPPPYAHCP